MVPPLRVRQVFGSTLAVALNGSGMPVQGSDTHSETFPFRSATPSGDTQDLCVPDAAMGKGGDPGPSSIGVLQVSLFRVGP